jgi:two-component system capsular synthesis response regulator RcsB
MEGHKDVSTHMTEQKTEDKAEGQPDIISRPRPMSVRIPPVRVIVADDHPAVILGVEAILRQRGSFRVVARASSTDALLDVLDSTPADLLLSDFMIPDGEEADGLSLIGKILRTRKHLPVVVLTMLTHAETLAALLRLGVLGLVDKRGTADEISVALSLAHISRTYVSPTFRELISAMERQTASGVVHMSPREMEVVRRFATGISLPDIARQLHRSRKTVSRQKRDAMRKIGITTDSELLEYARRHGMAQA